MGGNRRERFKEAEDTAAVVPDPILPEQLAHTRHRHTSWTPELSLMTAVLEDAIRTFCRYAGSPRVRARRLFEETAAWFESHDGDSPFGFEWISDALGLEPDWIRRGLGEWLRSRLAGGDQHAKIPSVRRVAGGRNLMTPPRTSTARRSAQDRSCIGSAA